MPGKKCLVSALHHGIVLSHNCHLTDTGMSPSIQTICACLKTDLLNITCLSCPHWALTSSACVSCAARPTRWPAVRVAFASSLVRGRGWKVFKAFGACRLWPPNDRLPAAPTPGLFYSIFFPVSIAHGTEPTEITTRSPP